LQQVMRLITAINPSVSMMACEHCCVPPGDLLNVRAFDPSRNKAILDLSSNGGAIVSPPILIRRDASGKILRQKITVNMAGSTGDAKTSNPRTDICTVSLTCTEPLDLSLFNLWVSALLKDRGEDLFRLKGILNMAGHPQQFVAQGVHMIFDGERGPLWAENQSRRSRLVLIGKGLSAAELEAGFSACRKLT
jgi:G3E family GTPase